MSQPAATNDRRPVWLAKVGTVAAVFVVTLSAIVHTGDALECLLCAEGNLSEFGECAEQHRYDCAAYERRFPVDDRVYCRTTRHRSANKTYTVIKECIAESAHFATFGRGNAVGRNGRMRDEECDVIEVDGYEVAYCMCRGQALCNRDPIADQFTAFEEKYPELFEPTQPTAAVGGFDLDAEPSTTPSGLFLSENFNDDSDRPAGMITSSHSRGVDADDGWTTNTVLQRPTAAPTSALAAGGAGTNTVPALYCMKCSESDLPTTDADCRASAAVACPPPSSEDGRSLCFSRQIITATKRYGVEKMCVTERALAEEFGDDAVVDDGCQTVDSGGVVARYCVCRTPYCNRASVPEQMGFGWNDLGGGGGVTAAALPSQSFSSAPPSSPRLSSAAAEGATPRDGGGLLCAKCLNVALLHPMQDCESTELKRCDGGAEPSYCLTRQTQNGKGSFIVEKRCTTASDFYRNFPEERKFAATPNALSTRCASTYDGYVNFCVCATNACNRAALPQQAEQFAARTKTTTSRPPLSNAEDEAPGQWAENWEQPQPIQPVNQPPSPTTLPTAPPTSTVNVTPRADVSTTRGEQRLQQQQQQAVQQHSKLWSTATHKVDSGSGSTQMGKPAVDAAEVARESAEAELESFFTTRHHPETTTTTVQPTRPTTNTNAVQERLERWKAAADAAAATTPSTTTSNFFFAATDAAPPTSASAIHALLATVALLLSGRLIML